MNNQINPKRILIFELNWMGDILFSFPFLRAVREAFPDACIACAVVPRYKALLANNPWIDKLYVLSDNNRLSSLWEKLKFVRIIAKEKYDTCFMLKPSKMKTFIAALSGIYERIGFRGKSASLTKEVDVPLNSLHRVDRLLTLAKAAGIPESDNTYEYFVRDKDLDRIDMLIRKAGGGMRRILALNPGGNWDAKRWSSESFICLAKKVLNRFSDVEIVITGAKKDVRFVQSIVSQIGDKRCYTVAGKTTLNELSALFKKCNLMVSADSGPLHLASAVGTTTIGLFGPTEHRITGPRGKGRSIIVRKDIDCEIPCYKEVCKKDNKCMREITVNEVFTAVEEELVKDPSRDKRGKQGSGDQD